MVATVEERLAKLETEVATLKERAGRVRQPGFGVAAEEVRERLRMPFVRSPQTIEKFRRMYAVFEGPEDLSEHMRDYARGEDRVGRR